jgi:hypothetical protein
MKKSLLLSSILTFTFGLWTLSSSAQVCFNPKTDYPVGSSPYFVITADFNADGKKDLATLDYGDGTVSISLGNGSGTFATPSTLATGNGPFAGMSADFNADGKADLAVSNYSDNTVSVYLGNGTGGFGAPVTFQRRWQSGSGIV